MFPRFFFLSSPLLHLPPPSSTLQWYFEAKRTMFPRFFFISDSLLLELLSAEPAAVGNHLRMLFEGVSSVKVNAHNRLTAMVSEEGEMVPFAEPVKVEGSVEEYLSLLVATMQTAISDIAREQAETIVPKGELSLVLDSHLPSQ
ncbi:dynein heavy chain, N-terminal region 2-domain-containing protein, partial [Baffinella frigidus]